MKQKTRTDVVAKAPQLALAVMLGAVFMVLADVFIATIATPAIRADLGAQTVHIQLALALYNISYGSLLLGGARLGDRFGHRRMFLAGCSVFCGASIVCAIAPNAEMLVAGRLLQGIGPALLIPQVFTFIQIHFTGSGRLRAFGAFSAVSGVAAAGSQALGGALIDLDLLGLGWRAIFWVNVPIMLVVMLIGTAVLPRAGGGSRAAIDGAGLAAVTLCLLSLTTALSLAQHLPGVALITALLAALGFILARASPGRARRRGYEPIIDSGLIRRRGFRGLLISSVAFYAGNAILFSLLPVYLISARGYSATAAGLFFVALAGTFAAVSVTLPRLVSLHPKIVLTIGSTALLASYGALVVTLLAAPQVPAAELVTLLVLVGAAMGGVAPSLNTLATSVVPTESAASASGLITTALEIGYGLGATVGIGSFALAQTQAMHSGHALAASVSIAAVLTLVLAAIVMRTPRDLPMPPEAE